MYTFVEIVINIKTHDNKSVLANIAGGSLGPLTTAKQVSFQSHGGDIEDCIKDCHAQALEFLESEAIKIGSVERRIVGGLESFDKKKKKFTPQRSDAPDPEQEH